MTSFTLYTFSRKLHQYIPKCLVAMPSFVVFSFFLQFFVKYFRWSFWNMSRRVSGIIKRRSFLQLFHKQHWSNDFSIHSFILMQPFKMKKKNTSSIQINKIDCKKSWLLFIHLRQLTFKLLIICVTYLKGRTILLSYCAKIINAFVSNSLLIIITAVFIFSFKFSILIF